MTKHDVRLSHAAGHSLPAPMPAHYCGRVLDIRTDTTQDAWAHAGRPPGADLAELRVEIAATMDVY